MTQQSNDRLERIEQHLDETRRDLAVAAHTIANTNRSLADFAELLTRSYQQTNERLDRTDEQIARNAQAIQFLQEMTRGHIVQPAPPAHSERQRRE